MRFLISVVDTLESVFSVIGCQGGMLCSSTNFCMREIAERIALSSAWSEAGYVGSPSTGPYFLNKGCPWDLKGIH